MRLPAFLVQLECKFDVELTEISHSFYSLSTALAGVPSVEPRLRLPLPQIPAVFGFPMHCVVESRCNRHATHPASAVHPPD